MKKVIIVGLFLFISSGASAQTYKDALAQRQQSLENRIRISEQEQQAVMQERLKQQEEYLKLKQQLEKAILAEFKALKDPADLEAQKHLLEKSVEQHRQLLHSYKSQTETIKSELSGIKQEMHGLQNQKESVAREIKGIKEDVSFESSRMKGEKATSDVKFAPRKTSEETKRGTSSSQEKVPRFIQHYR